MDNSGEEELKQQQEKKKEQKNEVSKLGKDAPESKARIGSPLPHAIKIKALSRYSYADIF